MRLGAPALLLNRVWDQPRTNTQQCTLATAIPNEGHRQAATQTHSKPVKPAAPSHVSAAQSQHGLIRQLTYTPKYGNLEGALGRAIFCMCVYILATLLQHLANAMRQLPSHRVGRDELVVELAGHHLKQSVDLKASNSEAQTRNTRAARRS